MPNERFSGVKQLFLSNENIPYVILRNWETLGNHDIEVLVLNLREFVEVFQIAETKHGFYKTIGNKKFVFKLRTLTDHYFPVTLAERVLKGRIKDTETKVFVPHPGDCFVSFLYHALYHQETMTADDLVRLAKYFPKDYRASLGDRDYAHQYLCNLGYFPERCDDKSVGYFWP